MNLAIRIHGREVKADTLTWIRACQRALGCAHGAIPAEDVAAQLQRLAGSVTPAQRRCMIEALQRRIVAYAEPGQELAIPRSAQHPGAVAATARFGNHLAARPEEWIAALLMSLSADARHTIIGIVQRGGRAEMPGQYVLHAEGLVLGVRSGG